MSVIVRKRSKGECSRVGREWSYNSHEDWDLPCRSNDPQIELNYPLDQLFSNGEQFPRGNNLT